MGLLALGVAGVVLAVLVAIRPRGHVVVVSVAKGCRVLLRVEVVLLQVVLVAQVSAVP